MLLNLFLLFSQVSANELMYKSVEIFKDMENINPSINLKIPFIYSFPRKINCIHIFTDKSMFAESLLRRIMKANITLSYIQGISKKTFGCNSYLLLSRNLTSMTSVLHKLPKWSNHRILCLINIRNVSLLETFVKVNSNLFGDAQALVVTLSNITRGYRIGQPIRKFKKFYIATGFWELDEAEISNFQGREIKISTYNCSIFSQLGPLQENGLPTHSDGYDFVLFKEIASRVNATHKVMPMEDIVKHGIENSPAEMINKIIDGEADIGFCGSLVESSKVPLNLELSTPLHLICFIFAVHRPPEINNSILSIFRPFNIDTWFILFITVVSISVVLLALAKRLTSVTKFETKQYGHFGNCLLTIFGILVLGSWPKLRVKLGPIRHIITWWVVFALILTNSYTSTLVSVLAAVRCSSKYNYINEFLNHGYSWPVTKPPYEGIFDMENIKYKRWFQRVKVVNGSDLDKILKEDKKSVILTQQISKINVPFGENVDEEVLKQFETVNHCTTSHFEGFLYRVGSPFNQAFNHYIRKLMEAGITNKLFDRVLLRRFQHLRSMYELRIKRSTTKKGLAKKFKMENLNGIFDLLILGLMISVLVFIGEVLNVKIK